MKTLKYALAVFVSALVTAGLFLWIAAGEIYDYEDTFDFHRDALDTDVVICLAGGKGRIAAAFDVWLQIKHDRGKKHLDAPILYLSGVGPNAGFETLAEQGVPRETLKQISKDEIIFENVSENTYENAQIFSSFAKQKHWKQALLITAGYHMRRAHSILRKVLEPEISIKTETVDTFHFDRNRWRKDSYSIRVTIIEYFKWLYYRYSY